MPRDLWQDFLVTDEPILWQGAPVPGIHQKARLGFLAAFGLPFLLVGIGMFAGGLQKFWQAQDMSETWMGLFLASFAIPFGIAGAVLVFGQYYTAATAHRRIRYALSPRAAFVAKSYLRRSLASYPIGPDTPVELEKGKSADCLWFHIQEERDSEGPAAPPSSVSRILSMATPCIA